jgi:Rrf2 family protein
MQISLGNKGDYSVRAIIALARVYPGRRKARQIAKVMDIPDRYLPQVMAPLVHRGIVMATAGPDGGYELARAPELVTLLDVIEAAEGPIAGDHCLLQGGPADWEHECPVHQTWKRAHTELARELGKTTFRQLAENDRRIERGERLVEEPSLHPKTVARRGEREPEA